MRFKIETLTWYRVRDTKTGLICHAHLSREEAERHIEELDKENARYTEDTESKVTA